jgi:hypothetical protein
VFSSEAETVRVKKTLKISNLVPDFDSIETETGFGRACEAMHRPATPIAVNLPHVFKG